MLNRKEMLFRGERKFLQFDRIYGTKHMQDKIFGTQKKEYRTENLHKLKCATYEKPRHIINGI